MPIKHLALTICLSLLFLQGCSDNSSFLAKDNLPYVHTIDIQQGNVITQEMLAQLEYGMDKKKVRFIMGTPLITDTFHSNRWDYVYTFKKAREQREQRRVTLFFEDELLTRVEGDIKAAHGEIKTDSRIVESIEVPPAEAPGLFSRVKEKLSLGEDDAPNLEKKVDEAKGDTNKAVEAAQTSPGGELAEEQEESIVESDPDAGQNAEEEKGFFGKMWDKVSSDSEEEVDPNDAVLNDPNLNPEVDP
ncbi:MAG: outer membrane protein assembly factor BamE [Gammaproteobacteria bacterium]